MKVGSSLDTQIWYDPYQAREFRLLIKSDFLMPFLMNLCNVCSVLWFLVFMNPVLETSKQLTVVEYPVMSVRKCEYFLDFS